MQLFFIFFGLPSLGVRLTALQAAILAMTINLTAYTIEILRAGIEAVPPGQREAGLALGIHAATVFIYVVLPQAVANVYPALVSQIVITMLESAVVSQIAVADLTHVADLHPVAHLSRIRDLFRDHPDLSVHGGQPAMAFGARRPPAVRRPREMRLRMISLSLLDILRVPAAGRALDLAAFRDRFPRRRNCRAAAAVAALCAAEMGGARSSSYYIELLQGTPLLLQLFLVFFGLPLVGHRSIAAAGRRRRAHPLCRRVSRGDLARLRRCRAARPVGGERRSGLELSVADALCDPAAGAAHRRAADGGIPGAVDQGDRAFVDRRLQRPDQGRHHRDQCHIPAVLVYGLVALIYFAMCYPLTVCSRVLERKLGSY